MAMSKFEAANKVTEVQKMELGVRQLQIKMEYRAKCLDWAMRTTPPTTPKVLGVTASQEQVPPTVDAIIGTANKYFAFVSKE